MNDFEKRLTRFAKWSAAIVYPTSIVSLTANTVNRFVELKRRLGIPELNEWLLSNAYG